MQESSSGIVGPLLRRLRIGASMTQAQLAKKAAQYLLSETLGKSHISRLEKGEVGASIEVANALATVFNVPLDLLIGRIRDVDYLLTDKPEPIADDAHVERVEKFKRAYHVLVVLRADDLRKLRILGELVPEDFYEVLDSLIEDAEE